MKIESYKFGNIIIDGKSYTNDLKIVSDTIKSNWWRERGHFLQVLDLDDVFSARPDKLIIGKGNSGLMSVSEKVFEKAQELGIETIPLHSKEACERFNREKGRIAFAIHLTC